MTTTTENREIWRLLPYDLGPSDRHFALSDALARHAEVPTIWAHSTDQPTLILGAGHHPGINLDVPPARGIRVVRRQAGGTAVFAGPGVLGVDIALPTSHPLAGADVVEAYRWVGEIWATATQDLGVDARTVSIAEARASPATDDASVEAAVRMACFGSLSPYEVVSGGRKLVGLAQVRRRNVVLWQSGVNLHFDAETIAALLSGADRRRVVAELAARAVGLGDLIQPAPDLRSVLSSFLMALRGRLHVEPRAGLWTADEEAYASSQTPVARTKAPVAESP